MNNSYNILVEYLKDERKKRGMSQKELGEKIGVSFQSISHYENLRRKPPLDKFDKWINEFGLKLAVKFKNEK